MCYSAMVREDYKNYVHVTGEHISLREFAQLYANRRSRNIPTLVRLPRFLDRWFEGMDGPEAARIREAIAAYNAEKLSELEQEIFIQRTRVANAERKLAVKVTKTAQNDVRIGSEKVSKALKKLPLYKDSKRHPSDGRIFPMWYAPVIARLDGNFTVRPARYHLRQQGQPASIDTEKDGLYNARRNNLPYYWGRVFGRSHAILQVETFYENVDRNGKNAVLHFMPNPPGTMYIACLIDEWTDPAGIEPTLLSFAAITDVPPPEVAAAGHDRIIISIKPENIERWLTPEGRSNQELQAILDDRPQLYYENEEVLAA